MKIENIETMQRAAGIVEGLSWVAEPKMGEVLNLVVEMLDSVLSTEVEEWPNGIARIKKS